MDSALVMKNAPTTPCFNWEEAGVQPSAEGGVRG